MTEAEGRSENEAGPALGRKVAIVTGAGRGIGECIARFLAADGATVVLADIDVDAATSAAARIRADGGAAAPAYIDVADPVASRRLAESVLAEHGKVDILVNNAGLDAPLGLPWEIDQAHWRRVVDTNLSGQWWCTQALLNAMMERRSGRIIFISSVDARVGEIGTSVAYNAAKAGLIGLTIGLATYLEPHGVLVNAIAPGPTGTTGRPVTDEERERYPSVLPLGVGGPEPIGRAAAYLAGPGGDWISGTVMNVSGGMWHG